jgi:hypothetical protein
MAHFGRTFSCSRCAFWDGRSKRAISSLYALASSYLHTRLTRDSSFIACNGTVWNRHTAGITFRLTSTQSANSPEGPSDWRARLSPATDQSINWNCVKQKIGVNIKEVTSVGMNCIAEASVSSRRALPPRRRRCIALFKVRSAAAAAVAESILVRIYSLRTSRFATVQIIEWSFGMPHTFLPWRRAGSIRPDPRCQGRGHVRYGDHGMSDIQ